MKLYFVSAFCRKLWGLRARGFPTKLLITLLAAVFAAHSPLYAAVEGVEIIASSKQGFHFAVTVDPQKMEWFTDSDSLMNGYVSVLVGVPHGARAAVVSAGGRQIESSGSLGVKIEGLSSQQHPLVEISDPFTVRQRELVSVRIFPVMHETFYGEMEVNIAFTGGIPLVGEAERDGRFERIFASVVANYEQFATWPVPLRPASKLTGTLAGPFTGAEVWFKMTVTQNGLYRVTGSQLEDAGLSLSGLAPSDIKIFNAGGLPLEVDNDLPRPELTEIAILVEDGGDGVFNRGDYILFFGEAHDRWVYSAEDGAEYVNNPYSDQNVYWLTVGPAGSGLRWETQATVSASNVIDTFPRYIHVEQDNLLYKYDDNRILDYFRWYWSRENTISFFVPAFGILDGDTAEFTVVARTSSDYVDLSINNVAAFDKLCTSTRCTFRSTAVVASTNLIDMELWPTLTAPPHFDYLELKYTSRAEPIDNKLDLTLGALDGDFRIEVMNEFSSTPLILDVTDPLHPEVITSASVTDNLIAFGLQLNTTVFNRLYMTPVSAALTPSSITAIDPPDLYSTAQQADLIVVAPEGFVQPLQPYLSYRQGQGHALRMVTVESIMDNFGFGLYDPLAIRDYLKFAYENYPSPAPSGVLFVGDGTYDYLDNLATHVVNFVPPCIHEVDQSASDDNYVYFGSYGILDSDTSYSETDRGFDMVPARWPVSSSEEVQLVTDKIARYESAAHFGIWRNNITLVADDEYTTTSSNETIHTVQTETLARDHIPHLYTPRKIYLWEYPFVGRAKPDVNEAIVDAVNSGTLIINYIGHGNPDVWAHEAVLVRGTDLPRLNNTNHLPLVFAASCAIGAFDDPTREGMAEDFLAMANGGAIGSISATRLVYSSANAEFNNAVYDVLLGSDSLSMCEAMYAAKLARQYSGPTPVPVTNDRKYLFFGGPIVSLAAPRLEVEFTEAPDTLLALDRVTVSGRVVNEDQSTYASDGTLYVNVYDSDREKTYRLINTSGAVTDSVEYTVTGPTIYRGSASIDAGQFSFDFIPPLDIGYGGQGARISVYAQFDDIDGAGIVDSIMVSDSVATVTDSAGPVIEVAFAGKHNFVSGDYISHDERLQVTISDPSGVNLTGALGHGITLEIDQESENLINLTSLFQAYQDDFTTGALEYPVGGLSAGSHHFKIKAWDNANNSSVYEFDAEVLVSEELAIRDLLNYPNPMNESTRFSFYLTRPAEKFSLELFTLSGKKVKSFFRHALEAGYYDDILWYGRDADGDRVATQVYIYKATAYPADGGGKVESFGKLVLIN